jgi:hypothetical protein
MRKILIVLVTLSSTVAKSHAQSNKDEAKAFFTSIVKSYFSNGDKLLLSFNDSIVIISPIVDSLFPVSILDLSKDTVHFHAKMHEWTTDVKSYVNYTNKYRIEVYDRKEFTANTYEQVWKDSLLNQDPDMPLVFSILHTFNKYYTDNDYFIVGSIPKSRDDKTLYGLYWMIVRKTEKGWKIFAIRN